MNRELLSLGLTAMVLLALLAFTQPTSAVLTTVSGPDEVTKPDTITFQTSVEIREDERVPIESIDLVIATDDEESVTVTFAPNGTVLEITPAKGVIGPGEIKIQLLRNTLDITPVESNAEFGYGYGYGTNERTGESRSFGYGYGYAGDGQPSLSYEVIIDSKAFKQGGYTLQLSVNTADEEGLFASNEQEFEVLSPSADRPERGPPETLPSQVPDHVNEIHDTIRQFLDGALDGSLGPAVSDIAGNGNGKSNGPK